MSARLSLFDGCYDASRVASLAGMPVSTVYDWARKDVIVPSISAERTKLWSYADLMGLRVVYWLRHRKPDATPASPMRAVREALGALDDAGLDLWSPGDKGLDVSPLRVDGTGRIFVVDAKQVRTVDGQGLLDGSFDLLGPFDHGDGNSGPDLRRPRPHLRIVPGKLSGEPHLAHSRLTTLAVAALSRRGYDTATIQRLYPDEDAVAIEEAIDLELQLAA